MLLHRFSNLVVKWMINAEATFWYTLDRTNIIVAKDKHRQETICEYGCQQQ
jgi:hypothetical protein